MSPPEPKSAPAPEPLAARVGGQAALLERIDARLERIEARLAKLDPLLDAIPGLAAMAGDSFDELAANLGDADERVRGVVALAERVTRPQTLAQLHAALDLLDSAPGLLAIVGDGFDEFFREAAARGLELDRIVPELGRSLEAVLRLFADAEIRHLLDSELFSPGAVAVLGAAARALTAASRAPATSHGLLGTLRALREPEVQRAVGFALDVARRFGSHVDQPQLPPGE